MLGDKFRMQQQLLLKRHRTPVFRFARTVVFFLENKGCAQNANQLKFIIVLDLFFGRIPFAKLTKTMNTSLDLFKVIFLLCINLPFGIIFFTYKYIENILSESKLGGGFNDVLMFARSLGNFDPL